MAWPRTLPDADGLARLVRSHRRDLCPLSRCEGKKHTYREIARGFGVHESAVYQAMRRAGLTDEGSRHDHTDTIPWTLRTEHRYKRPAEMLRLLSRLRMEDAAIPPAKRGMLIRWLTMLAETQRVVTYDPETPPNEASDTGGWAYVKRRPGDADEIRPPDDAPPTVYTDLGEQEIWSKTSLSPDRRRTLIGRYQRQLAASQHTPAERLHELSQRLQQS